MTVATTRNGFNTEEINPLRPSPVRSPAIEGERLFLQAQVIAVEKERHRPASCTFGDPDLIQHGAAVSGWRMMANEAVDLETLPTISPGGRPTSRHKEMRLLLFQLRRPCSNKSGW
jgi:hypothetical protein